MARKIRGVMFEENLKNKMGLQFYDLSHPWGLGQPCWPYFEDVKIERLHSMAKSGVLTQRITTVMHSGTHVDAPGHVVEGNGMGPSRFIGLNTVTRPRSRKKRHKSL